MLVPALQELEMLFREMSDRARRADMVSAAKNVCLDMDTSEKLWMVWWLGENWEDLGKISMILN